MKKSFQITLSFLFRLALVPVVLACRSAPTARNDSVAHPANAAAVARPECAIYGAVLDTIYPNAKAKPPVLMDSTFERVYQNAFRAWTTLRAPISGPGSSIARITLDSLRAVNPGRFPLPACSEVASFRTIAADTLRGLFSGAERGNGWERFYARYPNTAGFTGVSRIAFNNDSTEAIAYVAHHSEWLSGHGTIFRLRLSDGKWLIIDRRVVWVS